MTDDFRVADRNLLAAAKLVDAQWDEADEGTEDAADGLLWLAEDPDDLDVTTKGGMADALRALRRAISESASADPESRDE